jgi:hypothetical protein
LYNALPELPLVSIDYVIDKERRLVVTTASGRVTFAEAKSHQDRLAEDPDFDETFSQLLDATAATSVEVSVEQLRMLAMRRMFSASSRRAFVATNPAVFGVGRILQSYLEIARAEVQVSVFYDRASALKWLGLEHDPAAPQST